MTDSIRNYKTSRGAVTIILFVSLAILVVVGMPSFCATTSAQQRTTQSPRLDQRPGLYNRDYLRGYTTGFRQGQLDWRDGTFRDARHWDQSELGQNASEEARKGHQLGFQLGYSDGYYGRARNPVVPTNARSLANSTGADDTRRANTPRSGVSRPQYYPPLSIPENTEMRLRLTTPLSTKTSRVGDRFTAAITSPVRYTGATVEGHIVSLNRSGRVTGKTEMALAFDSITLEDRQQGPLYADLEKILLSDSVKKVDEEGRIETGSRTRDSEIRGGVGAAAGAIIGGITGGGKGALIGLVLGGAAGVGTVYIEGNNDLILDPGTEMVIRTTGQRQR